MLGLTIVHLAVVGSDSLPRFWKSMQNSAFTANINYK